MDEYWVSSLPDGGQALVSDGQGTAGYGVEAWACWSAVAESGGGRTAGHVTVEMAWKQRHQPVGGTTAEAGLKVGPGERARAVPRT